MKPNTDCWRVQVTFTLANRSVTIDDIVYHEELRDLLENWQQACVDEVRILGFLPKSKVHKSTPGATSRKTRG